MQICYEQNPVFQEWAEQELDIPANPATRIISILGDKQKLLAVILYSGFSEYGCEMRIASTSPRWCSRRSLQAAFSYPFIELKLCRILAATDTSNPRSAKMLLGLGFQLEGILRKWKGEHHALLYGMLKEECKWL